MVSSPRGTPPPPSSPPAPRRRTVGRRVRICSLTGPGPEPAGPAATPSARRVYRPTRRRRVGRSPVTGADLSHGAGRPVPSTGSVRSGASPCLAGEDAGKPVGSASDVLADAKGSVQSTANQPWGRNRSTTPPRPIQSEPSACPAGTGRRSNQIRSPLPPLLFAPKWPPEPAGYGPALGSVSPEERCRTCSSAGSRRAVAAEWAACNAMVALLTWGLSKSRRSQGRPVGLTRAPVVAARRRHGAPPCCSYCVGADVGPLALVVPLKALFGDFHLSASPPQFGV